MKSESITSAMAVWRETYGLSQEAAAQRLGVALSTYRKYEKGVHPTPEPILMLMTAVARGLDLEPFDLTSAYADT